MPASPCFTVFTPTFNRAHTLPRVYAALAGQTYRDFEWLVVDDGSTDGTRELIEKLRAEASFPIRYFHQENQGKHIAWNRGVDEARGQLFLLLDSDDSCVPEALERFKYHWDHIPPERRGEFTGVTALCRDQLGRLIGSRFPKDVTDSDSNEMRYHYKVTGEKWGFHRIDVLRRFRFPSIPGVKFVPEGLVWSKIARSYKTRYVNEVLRIYWNEDTQGAQLSTGALSSATASALALWHRSILNDDLDWFRAAPASFLRSAVYYSRFSFDSGAGVLEQRRQLTTAPAQLLWLLAIPLGVTVSMWDRARLSGPKRAHRGRSRGK
jgi:glycosyltransferase involved in cell wall biosynthesis